MFPAGKTVSCNGVAFVVPLLQGNFRSGRGEYQGCYRLLREAQFAEGCGGFPVLKLQQHAFFVTVFEGDGGGGQIEREKLSERGDVGGDRAFGFQPRFRHEAVG